jgi:hypothetical protein
MKGFVLTLNRARHAVRHQGRDIRGSDHRLFGLVSSLRFSLTIPFFERQADRRITRLLFFRAFWALPLLRGSHHLVITLADLTSYRGVGKGHGELKRHEPRNLILLWSVPCTDFFRSYCWPWLVFS